MKQHFSLSIKICLSNIIFLGSILLSTAQERDTLHLQSPPSSSFSGVLVLSPLGQPILLEAISLKQQSYVFYKDFVWPSEPKNWDQKALQLNLKFTPPTRVRDLLREQPAYAGLLLLGTAAGLMNHQLKGIDKEIEERTMFNIYQKNTLPTSVKDPFVQKNEAQPLWPK